MAVEESQLVDQHCSKNETLGVESTLVGTCPCTSKMLLKRSPVFSLALLYAVCERFFLPLHTLTGVRVSSSLGSHRVYPRFKTIGLNHFAGKQHVVKPNSCYQFRVVCYEKG